MALIRFNSDFYADRFHPLKSFTQEQIKAEPMLFSANLEFAYTNGGPITKHFIEQLSENYKNDPSFILDSRVHMLMPGWYPCIPGWHLDDVPRTRSDGQPDHANPVYESEHAMALFGDASITEFIIGDPELEDVPVGGGVIYKKWNSDLDNMIQKSDSGLRIIKAPTEKIIYFDNQSFHRGTPATKNGWRLFIRASCNTHRKPVNEIRRQVQVYMSDLTAGW